MEFEPLKDGNLVKQGGGAWGGVSLPSRSDDPGERYIQDITLSPRKLRKFMPKYVHFSTV